MLFFPLPQTIDDYSCMLTFVNQEVTSELPGSELLRSRSSGRLYESLVAVCGDDISVALGCKVFQSAPLVEATSRELCQKTCEWDRALAQCLVA